MIRPSPSRGDEAFPLSHDEREVVVGVIDAYALALPDDRAQRYRALADAATRGEVPAVLVDALERVCTLALQTGRAREVGGAEAERVLIAVLRRSPGGRAMVERMDGVNRALAGLAGRPLRSACASMRLPGRYSLALDVEGVRLTLGLGPEGIYVESLGAG